MTDEGGLADTGGKSVHECKSIFSSSSSGFVPTEDTEEEDRESSFVPEPSSRAGERVASLSFFFRRFLFSSESLFEVDFCFFCFQSCGEFSPLFPV